MSSHKGYLTLPPIPTNIPLAVCLADNHKQVITFTSSYVQSHIQSITRLHIKEEGKEITLLSTKMLKRIRKSFSIKLEICTLA